MARPAFHTLAATLPRMRATGGVDAAGVDDNYLAMVPDPDNPGQWISPLTLSQRQAAKALQGVHAQSQQTAAKAAGLVGNPLPQQGSGLNLTDMGTWAPQGLQDFRDSPAGQSLAQPPPSDDYISWALRQRAAKLPPMPAIGETFKTGFAKPPEIDAITQTTMQPKTADDIAPQASTAIQMAQAGQMLNRFGLSPSLLRIPSSAYTDPSAGAGGYDPSQNRISVAAGAAFSPDQRPQEVAIHESIHALEQNLTQPERDQLRQLMAANPPPNGIPTAHHPPGGSGPTDPVQGLTDYLDYLFGAGYLPDQPGTTRLNENDPVPAVVGQKPPSIPIPILQFLRDHIDKVANRVPKMADGGVATSGTGDSSGDNPDPDYAAWVQDPDTGEWVRPQELVARQQAKYQKTMAALPPDQLQATNSAIDLSNKFSDIMGRTKGALKAIDQSQLDRVNTGDPTLMQRPPLMPNPATDTSKYQGIDPTQAAQAAVQQKAASLGGGIVRDWTAAGNFDPLGIKKPLDTARSFLADATAAGAKSGTFGSTTQNLSKLADIIRPGTTRQVTGQAATLAVPDNLRDIATTAAPFAGKALPLLRSLSPAEDITGAGLRTGIGLPPDDLSSLLKQSADKAAAERAAPKAAADALAPLSDAAQQRIVDSFANEKATLAGLKRTLAAEGVTYPAGASREDLIDAVGKRLPDTGVKPPVDAVPPAAPEPPVQPPAVQSTVPPAASSAAGEPSLPATLSRAAPRYGTSQLQFASDIDKAAFITAQTKPSRSDAKFLQFVMDSTGMSEAEVRAYGAQVRSHIGQAVADAPDKGVVQVPKFSPDAPAPVAPSAPDLNAPLTPEEAASLSPDAIQQRINATPDAMAQADALRGNNPVTMPAAGGNNLPPPPPDTPSGLHPWEGQPPAPGYVPPSSTNVTPIDRVMNEITGAIRAPIRTATLGLHTMRMGVGEAISHPPEFVQAIKNMAEIAKDPNQAAAISQHLDALPFINGDAPVGSRWADFLSNESTKQLPKPMADKVLEGIPGLGPLIKRNTAAGFGYLESLQKLVYNSEAQRIASLGPDVDSKMYQDLFDAVRHAGGSSGNSRNAVTSALGYSPNAILSRFKALADPLIKSGSPLPWDAGARAVAVKNLLAIGGMVATVNGIGAATGGKLSVPGLTPTAIRNYFGLNTKLGKVAYGATTIDPSAGYGPILRLFGNLATDVYNQDKDSLQSHLFDYARSELGPVPANAVSLYTGTDWQGKPFGPKNLLQLKTQADIWAPIAANSIWNAATTPGGNVAASLPSLGAMSVNTSAPTATQQLSDLSQKQFGKDFNSLHAPDQAATIKQMVDSGKDVPIAQRQDPWWSARDDALNYWQDQNGTNATDPLEQQALKATNYNDLTPKLTTWLMNQGVDKSDAETAVAKFLSANIDPVATAARKAALDADPGLMDAWQKAYNAGQTKYPPDKWALDYVKGK